MKHLRYESDIDKKIIHIIRRRSIKVYVKVCYLLSSTKIVFRREPTQCYSFGTANRHKRVRIPGVC